MEYCTGSVFADQIVFSEKPFVSYCITNSGDPAMSLHHASPGEVINIRPLGKQLKEAVSTAMFKSSELEVIREVLHAGKWMPEHSVRGEVTIQCLEGVIELEAYGKMQMLRAGEMVYLEGGEPHALRAVEDASALITFLLKRS
jgi:quercetin dioxygenase-like cupin family protein